MSRYFTISYTVYLRGKKLSCAMWKLFYIHILTRPGLWQGVPNIDCSKDLKLLMIGDVHVAQIKS